MPKQQVLTKSEAMARVRQFGTQPELNLRRALWGLGIRYRLDQRVLGKKPDLVFKGARLVVFVDGCFWHQCPLHGTMPKTNYDFWRAKLDKNKARDFETDLMLRNSGWTVIRVWEHEVDEDVVSVAKNIVHLLHRTNQGSTH